MKLVSLRGSALLDVMKHIPYFHMYGFQLFCLKKRTEKKASENKNLLIECRVPNIGFFFSEPLVSFLSGEKEMPMTSRADMTA